MIRPDITDKIRALFLSKNAREEFIEKTKIKKVSTQLPFKKWPKSWVNINFKGYPRFDRIFLPKEEAISQPPTVPITKVLRERISTRSYANSPLTIKQLSSLLYYSVGIKEITGDWKYTRRFYPSAGARYPIEVYVCIRRGKNIKPGVYHYNFKQHSLEVLRKGNIWRSVKACFGVDWLDKTNMLIGMTAVFGRSEIKYGDRGLRHIFLEAGHIGQNLYLCSTALNIGCCALGGYVDDKFNMLLGVDGLNESVVNAIAIGISDDSS